MDFSLNRSFVFILLIQYIAHYPVSKVIRKHTKLNRNHSKCFTNGTYQAISIDARKGVWVSAIFSDRNSFETVLVMGFCKKDMRIRTD